VLSGRSWLGYLVGPAANHVAKAKVRFDYLTDMFVATVERQELFERRMADLDRLLPDGLSVVGNASSLFGAKHGSEIDRRPTIRFNHAQIVDPVVQGRRWDFVVTSNEQALRYFRANDVQFSQLIFTAYLDGHLRHLEAIGSSTPVTIYPMRLSRHLTWICRARPTTGTQILYLLDLLGRRDVHIFGFDWKATPTFYDPSRTRDPHNHARERSLAKALITKNGWQLHESTSPG
jgi:hypothetical protein